MLQNHVFSRRLLGKCPSDFTLWGRRDGSRSGNSVETTWRSLRLFLPKSASEEREETRLFETRLLASASPENGQTLRFSTVCRSFPENSVAPTRLVRSVQCNCAGRRQGCTGLWRACATRSVGRGEDCREDGTHRSEFQRLVVPWRTPVGRRRRGFQGTFTSAEAFSFFKGLPEPSGNTVPHASHTLSKVECLEECPARPPMWSQCCAPLESRRPKCMPTKLQGPGAALRSGAASRRLPTRHSSGAWSGVPAGPLLNGKKMLSSRAVIYISLLSWRKALVDNGLHVIPRVLTDAFGAIAWASGRRDSGPVLAKAAPARSIQVGLPREELSSGFLLALVALKVMEDVRHARIPLSEASLATTNADTERVHQNT